MISTLIPVSSVNALQEAEIASFSAVLPQNEYRKVTGSDADATLLPIMIPKPTNNANIFFIFFPPFVLFVICILI